MLAEDPDYFVRHGYKVEPGRRPHGRRQPPGEGNALGHILFMFPNEHSVYLHDTPRAACSRRRRAFSHGCVRVEQPMRLAELVMGGARGWTRAPAVDARRDRAHVFAAARDPDPPRIFHRVRRRGGRAAGARRRLRLAARVAGTYRGAVKIEMSAWRGYRGRSDVFACAVLFATQRTSRRAAIQRRRAAGSSSGGGARGTGKGFV